jgi:hypothetical protein
MASATVTLLTLTISSELGRLRLIPLRVKGGCGRQANGTAGLPPAPEIPVRSGTYASCQ